MNLDLRPLALPAAPCGEKTLLIAGPCSAETEAQVMQTARELADFGVRIFRAGIWKPRTKPGGFEGKGLEALPWLRRVNDELGMITATEVATPTHIEAALKAGVGLLWIGARTATNPFALQDMAEALQGVDIPILVKNPVNPDIELWIGGLLRLNQAGVKRLGVIHRGFSTYGKKPYRNEPMWSLPIELRRRFPDLPIIGDPSHIGGKRSLIAPLAQQGLDLGFDGLIIETHCSPDKAWSDAFQQITPEVLESIIGQLVIRDRRNEAIQLEEMRAQIDRLDNSLIHLLVERMQISRKIGAYKKAHNLTIVQAKRYDEILRRNFVHGTSHGMTPQFIKAIFEAIHEESIRRQAEIMRD
ncbi:bifunctional 3-deoxy-7-phosphoheptulonate synthase/chorismate mutase type II [Alloprevotella tannerae]|uniref:bifunctional 3-deoxy-7-phosphoheptulonate synthase/chorismate mutase type II n=1 Tax=Alloprevotella tannerae TaxID=76122 RepID=UPI0028E5CC4B|nr:bifunctional 3-deoxy-7-phosphoheptulonate synthase/chorismate mutase type II [Alloprevotella tannerae]